MRVLIAQLCLLLTLSGAEDTVRSEPFHLRDAPHYLAACLIVGIYEVRIDRDDVDTDGVTRLVAGRLDERFVMKAGAPTVEVMSLSAKRGPGTADDRDAWSQPDLLIPPSGTHVFLCGDQANARFRIAQRVSPASGLSGYGYALIAQDEIQPVAAAVQRWLDIQATKEADWRSQRLAAALEADNVYLRRLAAQGALVAESPAVDQLRRALALLLAEPRTPLVAIEEAIAVLGRRIGALPPELRAIAAAALVGAFERVDLPAYVRGQALEGLLRSPSASMTVSRQRWQELAGKERLFVYAPVDWPWPVLADGSTFVHRQNQPQLSRLREQVAALAAGSAAAPP